jgi:hypothetical protein
MNYATVLDIGVFADLDGSHIAAHDRTEPDTRAGTDRDIARYNRSGRDPSIRRYYRAKIAEGQD